MRQYAPHGEVPRRTEREDALERLALVLELAVVVRARRDLRARVAEGLLDRPEIHARLQE